MKKIFGICGVFLLVTIFVGTTCWGLDEIVEKKPFFLMEFLLVSGEKISPVNIGYETYGTLAPSKDNVILICHYYSGNSHAAGKYSPGDKAPGYWDAIIGPGKPLDTDKYFIVSSDTLCNMNPKNPLVITTGPASLNPKTGKPYGMSFPLVTIRDFINLQYKLLTYLGVKKLVAVTGASMGGIQSFEWAVAYPDFVERVIPIIATPKRHAWLVGWLKLWGDPIKLDPKWNNGDYYGGEAPTDGMTYSLMLITLSAFWSPWADGSFGSKWADPSMDPYASMDNQFLVEAALYKRGLGRVKTADANSMLYLNKACTLFDIGHGFDSYEAALKTIKAKVLMIGVDTDVLFTDLAVKQDVEELKKAGVDAELFMIKSPLGHIGGVVHIGQASDAIKAFLAE
ncbi:MAG: homoserine O-acetyltransferase [Deltaproteobacteria bacterium]|nr:homoserine O-acetyltransferase [Deltaproteobacteria bacterium]